MKGPVGKAYGPDNLGLYTPLNSGENNSRRPFRETHHSMGRVDCTIDNSRKKGRKYKEVARHIVVVVVVVGRRTPKPYYQIDLTSFSSSLFQLECIFHLLTDETSDVLL